MENHHFQWVNELFLWPLSIAMQGKNPDGIQFQVDESWMNINKSY